MNKKDLCYKPGNSNIYPVYNTLRYTEWGKHLSGTNSTLQFITLQLVALLVFSCFILYHFFYLLFLFNNFISCFAYQWNGFYMIRTFERVNPFYVTGLFLLYPVKTSESPWFSNVFRGCRKKTVTQNGLKAHSQVWDNFGKWKPFKIDEKCFLFHLQSSFRS